MTCSNCAPEAEAPILAASAAAFTEATRNGGFTSSVPGAVDVATAEVCELDPHAASHAAASNVPAVLRCFIMLTP